MMLLNKIHLLKTKINSLKDLINKSVQKSESLEAKNIELEKRLGQLEELVKTQNCLNESIMNQLKASERERVKTVKDIQIIVATLKDVYSLVQNSIFDQDIFDEDFIKKKKKNNTYH